LDQPRARLLAWALGRDREAAKSYAAAAGMDLTATERALLNRLRRPVSAAGR
jgi:predicted RNA polymerase sigma factor